MLLVLGAAGGVGLAAVQIGKVCGAIVIAVARCVIRYTAFSFTSIVKMLLFEISEELRK